MISFDVKSNQPKQRNIIHRDSENKSKIYDVCFRPSFITLYMDIVDGAGHDGGPVSPGVNSALVEVDRVIGILMNGLKLRNLENCVNLIVLADHG